MYAQIPECYEILWCRSFGRQPHVNTTGQWRDPERCKQQSVCQANLKLVRGKTHALCDCAHLWNCKQHTISDLSVSFVCRSRW
jgi:hypothetical protein